VTTGNVLFFCLWYKRERSSAHSAIWFILRGYAPTPSYKSDVLMFRCSLYYFAFIFFSASDINRTLSMYQISVGSRRINYLYNVCNRPDNFAQLMNQWVKEQTIITYPQRTILATISWLTILNWNDWHSGSISLYGFDVPISNLR
jgi:hypothetical protein